MSDTPFPSSSDTEHSEAAAPATDTRISVELPREPIGKIISAAGVQLLILMNADASKFGNDAPRVGTHLCIAGEEKDVLAMVSALSIPNAGVNGANNVIAEVEVLGELTRPSSKQETQIKPVFRRGVQRLPALGQVASLASLADLELAYGRAATNSMTLGRLSHNPEMLARLDSASLLAGHFAVIGMPGAGKTCALVKLVRGLVMSRHPVSTVIFDLHNEYTRSFGKAAHIVALDPGSIPHWLLSFAEFRSAMEIESGTMSDAEIAILEQAIPIARKRFVQKSPSSSTLRRDLEQVTIGIETPIPFAMSDLIGFVERISTGKESSDHQDAAFRLSMRMSALVRDPQFNCFFGTNVVMDTLDDFIRNIFRLPQEGKPICVLQLGGLSSVVAELVVSLVARLSMELARWSGGAVPVLLCVEDAHRFVPGQGKKMPLAGQQLERIIEGGRKFGIALGLVCPRPRLLKETILEQISSLFAMRFSNHADQDLTTKISPENFGGVLSVLGNLNVGECIALGQAASIPMRLKIDQLPVGAIPMEHVVRMEGGDLPESFGTQLEEGNISSIIENWRFQQTKIV